MWTALTRMTGLGVMLILAQPVGAQEDVLPVTTRAFAEIAEPLVRTAPAEVVARARTRVAARLAAPVEALPVDVGDRVEAGAVVARLECTDFEDALDRARARLNELQARRRLAETRLERARRLRAEDAVSADQLDEARAEYDALGASIRAQRAALSRAERDVGRCTVTAPFAGAVVARPAEPGAFVQPGTPLVELVDPGTIVLSARLTGRDAESLAAAERIRFRADGREYPVDLESLVPLADTSARTREARLRFSGERPLPGRAGRVAWEAAANALPPELLVRRGGRLGVMLLDGTRARFRPLPQAVEGRHVPLDLPPDTPVIVRGRFAALDGAPVEVTE
jgi:RND family efflux transporter MFP subunit